MQAHLRVALGDACPLPDENLLAEVRFGTATGSAANPRLWSTGLQLLQGATCERWLVRGDVSDSSAGNWRFSEGEDFAWLGTELPIDDAADLAALSEDLFLRLQASASTLGKSQIHRVWAIIPDIHRGAGDEERYKQFCLGRHLAYTRLGMRPGHYPAATVVGSQDGVLRLQAIAASTPGTAVENPLQTSAYCYPRNYGPKSPSFSRALNNFSLLLISGTAAVSGSESQHPGDTLAQMQDIRSNLEALAQASPRAPLWPQGASYGRIYLRRPAEAPAVRELCTQLLPVSQTWPILSAAICREELLCEIESACR